MPRAKKVVDPIEEKDKKSATSKNSKAKKLDAKPKSKIAKTAKKASTSKATSKTIKKTTTTKKSPSSTVSKTRSVKKSVKKEKDNFVNILEYYDLPYRYNETIVKILAQTPKILFVYWDISDDDREKYIQKYGEYFFNDSYPVLLVHNKTLNYTQEVEINDFANSWYLSIPDSRCEYSVELVRRFKDYAKRNPEMKNKQDIDKSVSVVTSNNLIMPNDTVLLNELKPEIKYKNVKTNEETYKSVTHVLQNNNFINFHNLYQEIYQVEDLSNFFSLSNPSSGNPTSTFK